MWKMTSTGGHCEPRDNVSAEGSSCSLTVGEQQTGRPLDRGDLP